MKKIIKPIQKTFEGEVQFEGDDPYCWGEHGGVGEDWKEISNLIDWIDSILRPIQRRTIHSKNNGNACMKVIKGQRVKITVKIEPL